ncbi:DNA-3-methyladenine glycosylase [soil metagenome]
MTSSLQNELEGSAAEAAARLLGCYLQREIDGQLVTVKIVETEAYDQTDAASHSYKGKTPRTDVMFGPSGHLYVYFTYGMHYCCNVVVGESGEGAAVLIRAVKPLDNESVLAARRRRAGVGVTNGPAKLCQALAINKELNGHDLTKAPLRLVMQPAVNTADIVQTTRIGISQAKELLWRFYLRGNAYVSKRT